MPNNGMLEVKQLPYYNIISATARQKNAKVYFVGGCVRDLLLKRDIKDVDLTVFGCSYDSFASALAKNIRCAAIPFKDNIRLIKGGFEIDVSAPRGKSIAEDVGFRDFTINNLAADIDGVLIGDPTDLKDKKIRHVYPDVFDDDPIRILRGFRFFAQLGFDIADETFELMKNKMELIKKSPVERIYEELKKYFVGEYLLTSLESAFKLGLFEIIAGHNFMAFDGLPAKAELARVGAVNGGYRVFETVSAAIFSGMTGKLHATLNYPKNVQKVVANIVDCCSYLLELTESDAADIDLKKLAYKYNDVLNEANILALSLFTADNRIIGIVSRTFVLGEEVDYHKAELFTGSDMIDLGFTPGPDMGRILSEVKEKLAVGQLDNLEEAKDFVKDEYKATYLD